MVKYHHFQSFENPSMEVNESMNENSNRFEAFTLIPQNDFVDFSSSYSNSSENDFPNDFYEFFDC